MSSAKPSGKTNAIKRLLLRRKDWYKGAVKAIWILFICFIVGFPTYIFCVKINLFGLFGEMPSLRDIENP